MVQWIKPDAWFQAGPVSGLEKRCAVVAGEIGDGDDSTFAPQSRVGKGRNVAHVDAGAGHRPALVDSLERNEHERPDRGKDESRIERNGRCITGAARPDAAELPGKSLPGKVAVTREGRDLTALPKRNLRQNMRSAAEAVKHDLPCVSSKAQRAPADKTCTQQGRGLHVGEALRQDEAKMGMGDGMGRIAAIEGGTGELCLIAARLPLSVNLLIFRQASLADQAIERRGILLGRDRQRQTFIMKALVYQGPGAKALEDHAKPCVIDAGDAVVRITHTTICGTDLHILKGDVPSCTPGRILGHEGVGVIESVGVGVTAFKPGDHVLISCITSCGRCTYCRRGMYSHCATGGWLLGNMIDGTQAEYVRIPHADTSLYPIPPGADEEALVMLSDILPTGFECGVLNGKVSPGCTVAIVGAGPIGLACLLTAQFYSPAQIIMVDLDDNRLDVARRFGATDVINSTAGDPVAAVKALTEGRGVDTAVEAVGLPATFELCQDLVAPGGIIANVGVHGVKADLHLERLWSQNIAITTRLVDTVSTPMLLKTVTAKKIDPTQLITHRFSLADTLAAYDTFGRAAETHALKVLITP